MRPDFYQDVFRQAVLGDFEGRGGGGGRLAGDDDESEGCQRFEDGPDDVVGSVSVGVGADEEGVGLPQFEAGHFFRG